MSVLDELQRQHALLSVFRVLNIFIKTHSKKLTSRDEFCSAWEVLEAAAAAVEVLIASLAGPVAQATH